MKRFARIFFLLICFSGLHWQAAMAQAPRRQIIAGVFNAATSLPGQFISKPLHPGFLLGAEFRYNQSAANQWFQTGKLAFSYHQYAQATLQIYSETGFRRMIWKGIGAELRLGLGYLHAFPATELFKLENGAYAKQTNWGRPQAMAGAALGLNYNMPERFWVNRVFVDYQFYLQMPFVKSYVPLLPNTLLHAGVTLPFPAFK